VTIRPLVPGDVDAAAEADFAAAQDAALRHGVTPAVRAVRDGRAAVRRLLDQDPFGGFVAEEGGQVIGHAWLHVRGPIGTIGPVAVEPGAQRRGIGRALLEHCLQAAGPRISQVRLVHDAADLVALRCALSAGFRIVAPLLELVLDPATVVEAPPVPAQIALRAAEAGDVQRIVARDARPFGTPRPPDVERRLRGGHGIVAERGGTLAGFALAEPGILGAAAADDPDVVLAMLATLAAAPALRTGPLRALVLGSDRALVDGLRVRRFRPWRACLYLIRGGGTAPPPSYVLMSADLT